MNCLMFPRNAKSSSAFIDAVSVALCQPINFVLSKVKPSFPVLNMNFIARGKRGDEVPADLES